MPDSENWCVGQRSLSSSKKVPRVWEKEERKEKKEKEKKKEKKR